MHYSTTAKNHGMRHDPFKALVAPRPIGWIGSLSAQGARNLAPYSFFNAVADQPPMIMYSSEGSKDTLRNVQATGEFTVSIVSHELREKMNMTSAAVSHGVDEFALAGLTPVDSVFVKAPRVGESPAALECKVWKTVVLPAPEGETESHWTVVFGLVVGIYINDAYIRDGRVDTAAISPIARLGYTDYTAATPQSFFQMNRPRVLDDGKTAQPNTQPWDGRYP